MEKLKEIYYRFENDTAIAFRPIRCTENQWLIIVYRGRLKQVESKTHLQPTNETAKKLIQFHLAGLKDQ